MHPIDQSFTTPLLATTTDGVEIAWSRGASVGDASAPQLWAVTAGGDAAPSLVYDDPNHDATLLPIAVWRGHFAWVEERAASAGGWSVWYLERAGGQPVLVDQGVSPDWPLPAIALDDTQLVWTAVHIEGKTATSTIGAMDLATQRQSVIRSSPATQLQFTWPSLANDQLVYATMAGSVMSERHVALHDFGAHGADRQLDPSGARASVPAFNGSTVVWMDADNEFDWGSLVLYSMGTQQSVSVPYLGDEPYVSYPSVGRRFVAAWAWDNTRFWLYDLVEQRPVLVEQFDLAGGFGDLRPVVAGDLLVWIRGYADDSHPLQLLWASLPH
jgi:hypothetical protein